MHDHRRIILGSAAAFLFAAALLVEAGHFLLLSTFFLRLQPTLDSQLYLAMGRGWQNGLTFYQDLLKLSRR